MTVSDETIKWMAGLSTQMLIQTLMSAGRISYKTEDQQVVARVLDAIRSSAASERGATFHCDCGAEYPAQCPKETLHCEAKYVHSAPWQDCTRCGAAILNEHPNARGKPSAAQEASSSNLRGAMACGALAPLPAAADKSALSNAGETHTAAELADLMERAAAGVDFVELSGQPLVDVIRFLRSERLIGGGQTEEPMTTFHPQEIATGTRSAAAGKTVRVENGDKPEAAYLFAASGEGSTDYRICRNPSEVREAYIECVLGDDTQEGHRLELDGFMERFADDTEWDCDELSCSLYCAHVSVRRFPAATLSASSSGGVAREPQSAEATAAGLKFCCGHAERQANEIADLRNQLQRASFALLAGALTTPRDEALTFFIAQAFADGFFDDEGDQTLKERVRAWLLESAQRIRDGITIQEVVEAVLNSAPPAAPAEAVATEGEIVDALRPVVSDIFNRFDSLSRGQALQMLTDAVRSLRSAKGVAFCEPLKSIDASTLRKVLARNTQLGHQQIDYLFNMAVREAPYPVDTKEQLAADEIIERCAKAGQVKGDWRGKECADAIRELKGTFDLATSRFSFKLPIEIRGDGLIFDADGKHVPIGVVAREINAPDSRVQE